MWGGWMGGRGLMQTRSRAHSEVLMLIHTHARTQAGRQAGTRAHARGVNACTRARSTRRDPSRNGRACAQCITCLYTRVAPLQEAPVCYAMSCTHHSKRPQSMAASQ
jgi:hypothetical protein